jgi:hypothetical protein
MTHLKSTKARKDFVIKAVKKADPKKVTKIYLAAEKITGFKHKKHKK